jgi:hypothetical protein
VRPQLRVVEIEQAVRLTHHASESTPCERAATE